MLTARSFAERPNALTQAAILHTVCWIAQFIGHGVAEKRAPALLDNIIGGTCLFFRIYTYRLTPSPAVVLAPFFVHLEILFALGYRPQLHHDIKNSVGVEITKLRRADGDKKRAAKAKDL